MPPFTQVTTGYSPQLSLDKIAILDSAWLALALTETHGKDWRPFIIDLIHNFYRLLR